MGLVHQLGVHIIIGILHLGQEGAMTVLVVHPLAHVQDEALAHLEHLRVVVADYVSQGCLLHPTLHLVQVEEAFITRCALRHLVLWHLLGKLRGQQGGIHHLVLGITRMHAHAIHHNLGTGGIEVLVLQFAHLTAVHGVCPLASELLHIKQMCTTTDFLVGIEAHTHLAVLHLGVSQQVCHCRHYLCYTSLVVSTEQGMAIGNNEVLALVLQKFGELANACNYSFRLIQHDVRAIVVPYDAWPYIST